MQKHCHCSAHPQRHSGAFPPSLQLFAYVLRGRMANNVINGIDLSFSLWQWVEVSQRCWFSWCCRQRISTSSWMGILDAVIEETVRDRFCLANEIGNLPIYCHCWSREELLFLSVIVVVVHSVVLWKSVCFCNRSIDQFLMNLNRPGLSPAEWLWQLIIISAVFYSFW